MRPLVSAAGHDILTPTYTGLGERVHLASPEVDLTTHIQDIMGVLEYEDLREVILVGHSYGGMVITGAAARMGERISHLVYVDAFVPNEGESLLDLIDPAEAARFEALAATEGDGWRVPPGSPRSPAMPGPDRRLPHPLACFRQPVTLGARSLACLPRSYIYCNNPPMGVFDRFAKQARTDPSWRYVEMATGHNPQYTAPRELSDILLAIASDMDSGEPLPDVPGG